jgi:hypothetical protein
VNIIQENFTTCNRYIPSCAKTVNFEFYLNIRWKNLRINGKSDSTVIGVTVLDMPRRRTESQSALVWADSGDRMRLD